MTLRRPAALLAVALALVGPAQAQPPAAGARRALLIGIDRYVSPDMNSLKGAENDARRWYGVLTGRFDFPPANVKMLLNEEATRDAILDAIRTHLIQPTRRGDVAVLHFSGHGSQMPDDDGDEIDGQDETIVPHDSRMGTVFDIKDDELNALLRELGAKTPHVTVILDSCHSGTGARAVVGGRAREAKPDTRVPPAPPAGRARGLEARDGFVEIGANYVLISGALPHELSREATFDGVPQGALSHFLTRALDKAATDATYRDVMDAAKADVTAKFQEQHPQIEGPGIDTRVFGTQQFAAQPSVIVQPDPNASGMVKIQAGELHGLRAGATLSVYPPGTRSFTGPPAARVRVETARVFDSDARIEGGGTVAAHSRAILRGLRPADFRAGVALEGRAASPVLQAAQRELEKYDVVEVVTDPTAALLAMRVEGPKVLLLDSDGEVLGSVDAADADAGSRIAERAVHWGRWHSILAIKNAAPTVDVDLRVELAGTTPPQRAPEELAPGTLVNLVVENNSSDRLFVILLDLAYDGSVNVLRPKVNTAEALEPGGKLTHPVRAGLTGGRQRVLDVVKVIATTQPVSPALFRLDAAPRSVAPDAGGDALTRYLSRSVRGQARNLEQVVVDGWAERQRSLVVAVPPARAASFAVHMPTTEAARGLEDAVRRSGARSVCAGASALDCYQVADLGVDPKIREVVPPAPRAGAPPVLSTGELFEAAHQLRRDLQAERVEPLFEGDLEPPPSRRTGLQPKDKHDARAEADVLWSHKQIGVPAAWQTLRDARGAMAGAEAKGVSIAHPDTGFRPHPEIWGADAATRPIWADVGYDYFGEDRDATDDLLESQPLDNPAHGTGSGSAIVSPDGCQLPGAVKCPAGVARGARLVPLRVHRSVVHFDTKRLSQAITDASGTDRSRVGAATQVMSISMGGVPSWTLWQAARKAEQNGLLIIAAAGNYVRTVVWPARFESTIAVAATNIGCRPWKHTSAGSAVDISAPGESVWRATVDEAKQDVTGMGSGTTYATATLAGVAALWMARHQGPALDDLRQRGAVTATFRDLVQKTSWTPARPPSGVTCDVASWDAKDMGPGIVDAARLLAAPLPSAVPRSVERARLDELPLFSSLYPHGTAASDVRADYRRLFGGSEATGPFDVYEAEVTHHYALDASVATALDAVVLGRDRSDEAFARARTALMARDLSPSLRAALGP